MKKAARLEIKRHLLNQVSDIRIDIRRNKTEMKSLVARQTILKRKLPILHAMIRDLE